MRTDPENGHKALYINPLRIVEIVGMQDSKQKSSTLPAFLDVANVARQVTPFVETWTIGDERYDRAAF